ncbi:tRNA pseudouridine(55) synthase TruB [Granulosicoccaceae sp. 1_MG-2023]|nr:tRNA pseudouridine(55) synthase TruB [Granulosicoccaceae sp. 1_MG-2023]
MARKKDRGRVVNGILLLEKPLNLSSNKALQAAKQIFDARKAGHTGSLDPLATGMLPLCFGEATKVSGLLLDADKTYETDAFFGETRSTGDREGEILQQRAPGEFDAERFDDVLRRFVGEISQVPPMYSALKKDGKALYKLARKGLDVEREARRVSIRELSILAVDWPRVSLRVRCSKGTYIRTLVEDIGEALGCGAHVARLHRQMAGPFDGQPTYSLEALQAIAAQGGQGALDALLLAPDIALQNYPRVALLPGEEEYFLAGRTLPAPAGLPQVPAFRVYTSGDRFLGLGEFAGNAQIKPQRVFNL